MDDAVIYGQAEVRGEAFVVLKRALEVVGFDKMFRDEFEFDGSDSDFCFLSYQDEKFVEIFS